MVLGAVYLVMVTLETTPVGRRWNLLHGVFGSLAAVDEFMTALFEKYVRLRTVVRVRAQAALCAVDTDVAQFPPAGHSMDDAAIREFGAHTLRSEDVCVTVGAELVQIGCVYNIYTTRALRVGRQIDPSDRPTRGVVEQQGDDTMRVLGPVRWDTWARVHRATPIEGRAYLVFYMFDPPTLGGPWRVACGVYSTIPRARVAIMRLTHTLIVDDEVRAILAIIRPSVLVHADRALVRASMWPRATWRRFAWPIPTSSMESFMGNANDRARVFMKFGCPLIGNAYVEIGDLQSILDAPFGGLLNNWVGMDQTDRTVRDYALAAMHNLALGWHTVAGFETLHLPDSLFEAWPDAQELMREMFAVQAILYYSTMALAPTIMPFFNTGLIESISEAYETKSDEAMRDLDVVAQNWLIAAGM